MANEFGYTIINKDGKVVDDAKFADYDSLADHMLDMAEKYYRGEYSEDDKLEITEFDSTGEIIYSDVATFGESSDEGIVPEEFNFTSEGIPTRRKKAEGFGK
jgi:hypothetical protein